MILERIMYLLLDKMGYSVTRNEIGTGGNELDVVAQKRLNETVSSIIS